MDSQDKSIERNDGRMDCKRRKREYRKRNKYLWKNGEV